MIHIQPPKQIPWDSLQNKPAILSDNQISWSEIQNKPSTFPPASPAIFTGSASAPITLSALNPGIRFTETDATTNNKDWFLVVASELFQIQARDENFNHINSPLVIDRFGELRVSKIRANTLPTNFSGLASGSFYRDSNGFVKVVI